MKNPTVPAFKYKLILDLLMIQDGYYKIFIPDSLIRALLSYTHLLGHKGITRMLADLQSYYFKNMYSITRNFISCCWSCFLVNRGVKKNRIRTYPTPTYPFKEITLDLAEYLNPVNENSHLLIVLCESSDFILIFPSRSKRADHVCKILLINVLQPVNVRRLHSDNGPCFRAINWLETVAALNIQVIGSAALHPSGRGHIERTVGIVKTMLKKMLAIQTALDWEYLLFLI
jgi:hypothetical protein